MTREDVIEILARFVIGAKPCSQREIIDACASAYGMLKKQPSIPSNLDEAAEEYAYNNWEDNDYHTGASEGLPFDAIGHTEKCFKAGAEWMAGQGQTIESLVWRGEDDKLFIQAFIDENEFEMADNIIIQIRKKQ